MTPSKTAKLTGSAPVLFVRDVYAATKHYRDAMGFSFGDIFGEPPSFAILKRDNMYVMVKQIDDHKHIVPRWTVSAGLWDMYFWVDDVDALYKEFVERGASPGPNETIRWAKVEALSIPPKNCTARRKVFVKPYLEVASGSIPLLLISSDARGEARKSISRLEASISFEPATTAAENTWTS